MITMMTLLTKGGIFMAFFNVSWSHFYAILIIFRFVLPFSSMRHGILNIVQSL